MCATPWISDFWPSRPDFYSPSHANFWILYSPLQVYKLVNTNLMDLNSMILRVLLFKRFVTHRPVPSLNQLDGNIILHCHRNLHIRKVSYKYVKAKKLTRTSWQFSRHTTVKRTKQCVVLLVTYYLCVCFRTNSTM